MTISAAILGFIFAILPVTQTQAQAKCEPSKETERWVEATLQALPNSAQFLYQVRATGPFMTADLICSFEDCVGFIGGAEAVGKLTLGERNEPTGVRFQIKEDDGWMPRGEFNCR